MRQNQAVEAIDAARPQIAAHNAFKVAFRSAIDEPVTSELAQMNCGACAEVERGDFGACTVRPMRLLNIDVPGRRAGEQTHRCE